MTLRIVECKVITHECKGSPQGLAIIPYPMFASQSLVCRLLGIPKILSGGLPDRTILGTVLRLFFFHCVVICTDSAK